MSVPAFVLPTEMGQVRGSAALALPLSPHFTYAHSCRRCWCACCKCPNPHDNDKYVISYSALAALTSSLTSSDATNSLNILINSNDNLTLKWYYDKLIRLPIKVGTLDFHEIVDMPILKKYGVSIPSEKSA